MGLLEEALSDIGHDLLVLSDFGRDTHKSAEFGRQIDVLPFLSDFKQWLIYGVYFHIVSRVEVVNHVGTSLLVAVVKDIIFRIHAPLDCMHFVGPVRTVFGHDDCSFEFSVDETLIVALKSVLN